MKTLSQHVLDETLNMHVHRQKDRQTDRQTVDENKLIMKTYKKFKFLKMGESRMGCKFWIFSPIQNLSR